MDLPLFLSIVSTLIFGLIAIYLSIKEQKTKKLLLEKDIEQKQKIYQIAILKEIQERIGYSLDIEKVIAVITESLKSFFSYSTASSIVVKEGNLVFKTYVEEKVSHTFIEKVKKTMLASLSALNDKLLPSHLEETLSGMVLDETNSLPPTSFFNIPLIVNNEVVGLINISSTKPGLYKEDEMTILYQITHQASSALSKLNEVLRTEKGKLMSTIGSLADGVFTIDTQNTLLVINNAAKEMLRLKKENPTIFDVLASFPPEFDLPAKISQCLSSAKELFEKELAVGERLVQVFITPVSGANDHPPADRQVIGASVLLHDITLEKNLEKLKEDFTNIMVHELRAPLNAVKNAASLMLTNQNLSNEDQKKFMSIIHDQSKLLLDHVSSLLDASKIEAGKFTIQKAPSDLKKLIDERVNFFEPQAKEKNIRVSASYEQAIPVFSFDAVRIGQVLNNLLSNSLKFTPEGGRVEVRVSLEEDSVAVSVSDTGIGIPKEKQSLLFSKFSQIYHPQNHTELHASDFKSANLGTGLGLYIIKGIIEAHGGTIHLKSEEGKGTTIAFVLPLAQTEIIRTEPKKPEPPPPSRIFKTEIN